MSNVKSPNPDRAHPARVSRVSLHGPSLEPRFVVKNLSVSDKLVRGCVLVFLNKNVLAHASYELKGS